ncbi:PREDICTED: histone-lysine N-methyltransferase SETD2-like [Rhagoletis zephyria]|uniref:histone-lysine N-methyltransferase SETD2-like n=1 Tax=Rhagoletis zephyria TaxID=28612 RepID=UPI0008118876|nr:PREDICTED: histone-lysine N-methyltransferase SETD2-like [Rhagoletis zephyria]
MPSTAAAANEDSVLFATPLGPAPKRRGRPPKNVKVPKDEVDSTETENTDSTVLLPASQGESRRRSSRLKKLEKEKEPDLNGISNGHTLSNTHHTASKEKSKSKKHRHHKKHELDHPTATTDCQITAIAEAPQPQPINAEKHDEPPKELESSSKVLLNRTNEVCNESYPKFEEIDANIFCCERKKSKGQKEIKKMVCDCILSKEDRINGFRGCGDDCLNRMLMIECGSRCTLGDLCSNKRFSLKQYAKVEPFKTLNKGWGLRTLEDLPPHSFIMEYVGEVVDAFDFYKRVEKYEKRKTEHHYFMVLQADEFIDATRKGNVTRFINHSCDPNSQTEKWTVNGELRVGFFTFKHVKAGEEITFDYQFQRYGKKAQKCFCGTDKCCGYIGGKSANILTDGSKIPTKANKSKKKTKKLDEEQISNLEYEQRGLRNRQTTLEVSQIMIRTEKMHLKLRLIKIIMSTVEIAYLRLFLDYYGLKIIRNWMLSTGNDAEDIQLKARLLELLMILPIPNKTMLIHNKVLETVERWAQSDSPESSQYINPPNADATNKVNGDDVGGDGENGVKEESEEAKKSPAEELPKLAEKLVTKSSAKEETEKSSPTAEENITIGQLAQKVLDHWKDLIFVLRIPRLEIEKRHADEAEADRKTKEDEDKQTHQTPASAALKRPNEEEYHAGGHKRRFLRSLTDAGRDAGAPRRPFTGNHNHTSSNHRDDTASAATLAERQQDKEHRRRMFEYNEYQNAVIKWRKQMDDYNMQVLEISPLMALQQLENGSPLSVDSQSLATSITPGSASTLLHPQLSSPLVPGQAPEASGDSSENPTSIEKMYDKETEAYLERKEEEEVKIELTLKDIVPKFDSPLIILLDDDSVPAEKDVTLSPHAIDNVDYNEVRYYCDDVFESMEKRLFDEIYPPQGIFYIAPTGETYFLSMPSDLSQSVTVRENVAEPLPLSYTKRTSANIMLPLNCDWSCAEVEGETYYFNKHKQIKQWNPPQSNQIGTFTPMIAIPESKPLPLRIKRNKELVDLEQNFEKHIPVENRQHLFRIRRQLSAHVVKCLSPYNRRDCKHGRITSHEDFKYLARKITHHVIYKEYQHQSTIGKPIDKMVCSDSVKGKTKEYVKAYMNKYKREYRLS